MQVLKTSPNGEGKCKNCRTSLTQIQNSPHSTPGQVAKAEERLEVQRTGVSFLVSYTLAWSNLEHAKSGATLASMHSVPAVITL